MQKLLQEQFILLYENFKHELSCYCRAVMKDEDEAKDLMSETVLAAFESFEKMKEPEKFKYFLFGIASRLFKKKLRRKKIVQFLSLEKANSKASNEKTDDAISLNMLYHCIAKLKPEEAEAIVLFEISGCTLVEVSEIIQINLNTTKTNVYRGRKKLETMLQFDRELFDNPLSNLKTNTAIS
jgi:RNA polymerase sigma-70 factor (ECF subfamily)